MATSKLQKEVGDILDMVFPQYHIKENHRPEWMISSSGIRLELDFYIEELKTAFEIQGIQHYKFTPFFHKTLEDFNNRKALDLEKKDICIRRGVKLIEIFSLMDAIIEIEKIKELPIIINKVAEQKHVESVNKWSEERIGIIPKRNYKKSDVEKPTSKDRKLSRFIRTILK